MTSEPRIWKLPPLPPPTLAEIRHQWRKASPRYLKEAKAGVPAGVAVFCRGAKRAADRRNDRPIARWPFANLASAEARMRIARRLDAERAKLGGRTA